MILQKKRRTCYHFCYFPITLSLIFGKINFVYLFVLFSLYFSHFPVSFYFLGVAYFLVVFIFFLSITMSVVHKEANDDMMKPLDEKV